MNQKQKEIFRQITDDDFILNVIDIGIDKYISDATDTCEWSLSGEYVCHVYKQVNKAYKLKNLILELKNENTT